MKKYVIWSVLLVLFLAAIAGCSNEPAGQTAPKSEPASSGSAEEPEAGKSAPSESGATKAGSAGVQADSALPETLPAELKSVAELNGYAVDLSMEYIKPNIFRANLSSEEEKENARKALKLIIAAEDKAIALYDKNESLYYVRGEAYAQCYYDTKDKSYKDKALKDFQKAADMGHAAAKMKYESLKQE